MIFGTAPLGSKYSEEESIKILQSAYDSGFRHFDTAPSYGDGRAECILEKFLKCYSASPNVSVTSKYGIIEAKTGFAYKLTRRIYQFFRKKLHFLDYFARWVRPKPIRVSKANHEEIISHATKLTQKFAGATVSLVLHDLSKNEIAHMDLPRLVAALRAAFPNMLLGYSALDHEAHDKAGKYFDFVNMHWEMSLQSPVILPLEMRLFGGSHEIKKVKQRAALLQSKYKKVVRIIVFSSNSNRISKFMDG